MADVIPKLNGSHLSMANRRSMIHLNVIGTFRKFGAFLPGHERVVEDELTMVFGSVLNLWSYHRPL